MKIFVAIPVYDGKLSIDCVKSLLAEQAMALGLGDELQVNFMTGNAGIVQGRNQLAYEFMEGDFDRLVFLDSDVTFEPGALIKLSYMPVDFVGGCYRHKRSEESYPMLWQDKKELWFNKYGLLQVECLPTGFLALSRKVFETLRDKYPERALTHMGQKSFSYFQMPIQNGVLYGEDFFFCKEWRALGGDIFLDPEIKLTHWSYNPVPYAGNIGHWLKNRPPDILKTETQEIAL